MNFTDNFWGADFTSTKGFDVLLKRVQDGKTLCKDMDTYLKQRSKMELEYAKNLSKLHQTLKFKGRVGQLEESWTIFKGELENAVKIHKDCSEYFNQLGIETHKYIEDNSKKIKDTESRTKKTQQNKTSLYNKTVSLEKDYRQRCQEADAAQTTYSVSQQSVTTSPKERDKAGAANVKAQELMEKADNSYKASIVALETARQAWEQEMSTTCEDFQSMEEDRINYLRDLIWTCTNLDTKMATDLEMCHDKVRDMLDKCDIKKDICTFIKQFQTGNVKPSRIEYES